VQMNEEGADAPVPTTTAPPLVLLAVRLVAAWLAEESSALRPEVVTVLPTLLDVAMADDGGAPWAAMLAPGLLHLTADPDARAVVLARGAAPWLAAAAVALLNSQRRRNDHDDDEEEEEEGGAVLGLLGVLLNLAVLAPGALAADTLLVPHTRALADHLAQQLAPAAGALRQPRYGAARP
jgi:hypothetical protein